LRIYKFHIPLGIESNLPLAKKLILFIFFALTVVGCSPITKTEQPAHSEWIKLDGSTAVGQTFSARYDGLNGIIIFLKSDNKYPKKLLLKLHNEHKNPEVIRESQIELEEIEGQGKYSFTFTPLQESTHQDYYFTLELDGPGTTLIGAAPGNTYLNGSLYLDGQPQNSQLSFNLQYASFPYYLGIASELALWIGVLFVVLAITALPGWGALSWLFPLWQNMHWVGKISFSIGIGLAFSPLLLLWTNVVGIQLGTLGAWLLPVLGFVSILFKIIWTRREEYNNKLKDEPLEQASKLKRIFFNLSEVNWNSLIESSIPDLAFLIVMGFVILTRFWPIRNLDAPMWGDSYHHTMISQLLVDNGGLFLYWQPYAELNTFSYHFGFHSIVSIFHSMTGIDVVQATLWIGQLFNILAISALYPLALLIGKNKWAGVIAVLIAGMLSPMPMYYVNWGRYTQLAGQVILPAAIIIIWSNLESPKNDWKWNGLIWLVIAGLALTHYRVLIFIPLFYLAFLLLQFRQMNVLSILSRSLLHASGALILILPWIVQVLEGKLPIIFGQQISTSVVQISQAAREANTIGDISFYLPMTLWILMLVSIVWGIWQRNKRSNIFSLWWLLILLAANPNWLRLPGTGVMTNFAIFIAAYFPASILIGSAAGSFLSRIGVGKINNLLDNKTSHQANKNLRKLIQNLLLPIILVVLVFGSSIGSIRARLNNVQPASHALVTRSDVRATKWIDEKLPSDAKFLVNSFFAYGNSLVVGADAGWWLPLLANRENSQPPITYGSERGPTADYVTRTNKLVSDIQTKGVSHPDVVAELQERNYTHIYIGQQQGQVNASSPPMLNPKELLNDQNFNLLYHQDRVWIFEINTSDG